MGKHKDKHQIFNTNCQTKVLFDSIKQHCGFARDTDIDVANKYGDILHLRTKPVNYASEQIDPRSLQLLVKVDESPDGRVMYSPLFDINNDKDRDIEAKIASQNTSVLTTENRNSSPWKQGRESRVRSTDTRNNNLSERGSSMSKSRKK